MSTEETVAAALLSHTVYHNSRVYPEWACRCGWDGAMLDDGGPDDGRLDTEDQARAHVAAAITAALGDETKVAADGKLTLEAASALVGDDIAYWLGNPFMSPELVADKVCWWLAKALAATTPTGGDDV